MASNGAEKKRPSTKSKRAAVPFDWTTEAIEKISIAPPEAPVKLANTSLESIIERVEIKKREAAVRNAQIQKKLAKRTVLKPVVAQDDLKDRDWADRCDAMNNYFRSATPRLSSCLDMLAVTFARDVIAFYYDQKILPQSLVCFEQPL